MFSITGKFKGSLRVAYRWIKTALQKTLLEKRRMFYKISSKKCQLSASEWSSVSALIEKGLHYHADEIFESFGVREKSGKR